MADGLLSNVLGAIDRKKQEIIAGLGLLANNPQEWAAQATARYLPTREEERQYAAVKQAGGDITQTPYYQKIFDLAQFQGSIKPTGLLTPNQQAMAEIRKVQSERTPTDLSWVNNPVTPNPKTQKIDDSLIKIATQDTKKLSGFLNSALEEDAQGVLPNRLRQFDKFLNENKITEDEVKSSFKNTLDAIKQNYGDEIVLWRADAPKNLRNPQNRTVLMANEDVAKQFENNSRKAIPYLVKTDDILGVFAKPSGYYEVIVKSPETGLVPYRKQK